MPSFRGESNPEPRDYKSRALPNCATKAFKGGFCVGGTHNPTSTNASLAKRPDVVYTPLLEEFPPRHRFTDVLQQWHTFRVRLVCSPHSRLRLYLFGLVGNHRKHVLRVTGGEIRSRSVFSQTIRLTKVCSAYQASRACLHQKNADVLVWTTASISLTTPTCRQSS